MQPWIPNTDEHCSKLFRLAQRLGFTATSSVLEHRWLGRVTSYTLRESFNDLDNYYLARSSYFKHLIKHLDFNRESPATFGYFENFVMLILKHFSPEITDAFNSLTGIKDRAGYDRADPLSNCSIGLAYLPKGLTIFTPENKVYLEADSARIQRECIKESAKDPCTPDSDKTLTVKVFAKKDEYFHCYINKRAPVTLRRIIYKAFFTWCRVYEAERFLPTELEKTVFNVLLENLECPTESSADIIIATLSNYITEKIKNLEENLIQNFATEKQKALNSARKKELDRRLQSCQNNLTHYESGYRQSLIDLKNAEKAIAEYSEVGFNAIQTFLQLIKNYPRTQFLSKINARDIQFQIEEPLIHTAGAVWAKYLTNSNSDINYGIKDFALKHHKEKPFLETTVEILRFSIQRFIKELFVDQTIRLYTACTLGMEANDTVLDIKKYELVQTDYMPHPHIGTAGLTCWSEAKTEVIKALLNNDGETAFLQLTYALQQMSATDTVVSKKLINNILHPAYSKIKIYLRKGKQERESFIEILQEFITDETNKINAIIASES